ncbi:MAG: 50S ribosomal protein L9 [Candidatus Omnitrophota bacterium]|nr:50S ribosomal protein L9 [Candidatus Omnitrophota bacterium]MDZ4242417.1 50S ribosomal protein L9 [Candidatus Omnitrophota bacterium]
MEVILCQDVPKLGKVGKLVKVKDGYARNYLLPRKLACAATPANLKVVEHRKAKIEAENKKKVDEAQAVADKLNKVSCTVAVEVNDLEKMYGSVTEIDIARALDVEGFPVDKKSIVLEKPIEELGIFEIPIKLHPEVTAKIRLWVTKK